MEIMKPQPGQQVNTLLFLALASNPASWVPNNDAPMSEESKQKNDTCVPNTQ